MNLKIGPRITLTFFLIAFISMLVIGVISYKRAKTSLQKQSFEKLTAVREMKASQIQDYFQIIKDQLITYAEDPMIIEAMKDFKKGFNTIKEDLKVDDKAFVERKKITFDYVENSFLKKLNGNLENKVSLEDVASTGEQAILMQQLYIAENNNPIGEKEKLDFANDSSAFTKAHRHYHPVIRNFLEKFGYYDIFLIDNENGNIVYTVYKEVDFASSLESGPFKNTNLATAYNAAKNAKEKEQVKLVDYRPYHPSYNAPSSFIACPIFDGPKMIGVLAFQMPIDKINDIMTNKRQWSNVGLGVSGETYIVGGDYTLRNQSRFLIEDSINYFKMLENIGTDEKTIEKIKSYNSTIGLQEVRTEGTKAALEGVTDTRIFPDYRGVPVLSAFKPLEIQDVPWVIMSEIDEEEAYAEVYALRNNIVMGFMGLLVIVFSGSYFVSRQITRPLKELTIEAQELGNGNLNVEVKTGRTDEIGMLADSFKKMQSSISTLINDLRHMNHTLEDKVNERTAEVVLQKNIIEEKQKEIVDSILYAKRIQTTILAHESYLKKHIPEYFVFFKPKDIVSGDFYWATKNGNRFYVAVCDSTGHGVPGAFMSLLNISFLNEAINEKNIVQPNEVLNYVRKRLIKNISKDGYQDGMDGALVCIDKDNNTVSYAAAHNAPISIHNGQLSDYDADKMPIGIGVREESFVNRTLELKAGETLYLYTDGYADQFGGAKGKKFKYKNLNELIRSISHQPLDEQRQILEKTFEDWKGELEQIDDVCVFGIKF
jgi:serine phosphatase RsbU (regulator of sigma subunit)